MQSRFFCSWLPLKTYDEDLLLLKLDGNTL